MKGCIIIPYRDRKEHLTVFLEKVKVELPIIIIEQADDKLFNRGKLFNVGYNVYKDIYDYFIFHDIDMIPFKNVDYSYCEHVCHLARHVEQYNYKTQYETYLGGVVLFPKSKFELINGFSNNYWGWGQEDDNLFLRCQLKNIKIETRNIFYKSLKHSNNCVQEIFNKNIQKTKELHDNPEILEKDGLNTLNYEILEKKQELNYILIKVRL